jgi:hypothetical protein
MVTRPNTWPILAAGALGLIVGVGLIFTNHPIGRALIIASVIGMIVVLGPRNETAGDDDGAWFGRKRTGIGWTIRSWRGVVLLLALIVALVGVLYLTAG